MAHLKRSLGIALWFMFLALPLMVVKVNTLTNEVIWRWSNLAWMGGGAFAIALALFARLLLRGVHPNKVVIAIARELLAFVWELARILENERAAHAPQESARPAARKAS